MAESLSNRRIAVALSEIHQALSDLVLLMNAEEGEHRTMRMTVSLDSILRGTEKIRATLDHGAARREADAA
ncbi:hypothetical protein [Falsiroseomonas sp. CW058]|uniref:hypothetical protein n=1 Tax=Falsiroseomonas sp. CW058 TaxID=3388664 RepID=UPI003D31D5FA